MRGLPALILGMAIACSDALHAQAAGRTTSRIDRVDAIVTDAMRRWTVPGMSVVVMRGTRVLVAKGYGDANRASGARATAATVHQLGSISKQFTAAAIMRLAEQGRLRLSDPVSRHLTEYRPVGDSVQIRHLLHQTSGIREEFMLPGYWEQIADTTRPNAELIARIQREPLGFLPGGRWSYSNSNYALLATVVERITTKPYEDFLAREFFAPLRLSSIHHCRPLPAAPHHARGYVLEHDTIAPSPPENVNWIRGDGGLCASAEDLARWARALASGRVVSRASYREMTASRRLADGTKPDYGYGLSLVPLDRVHRRVSHGGRMAGFTAALAHYPDHDLTIAILANRGGLWIESLEEAVARAVLGIPTPRVRDLPTSTALRTSIIGTYDIGVHGMPVRIAGRGDELWIEWPAPGPTSKLLYQGGREFAAELEPDAIRMTFAAPDESGPVSSVVILMAGMHWFGKRVE